MISQKSLNLLVSWGFLRSSAAQLPQHSHRLGKSGVTKTHRYRVKISKNINKLMISNMLDTKMSVPIVS